MRELKFRAYIKPLKRYATGLDTIQFHKCCDVVGAGIWTVVTVNEGIFEVDDIIIEQYTGLKDKNSKEIYEGDIVRVGGKWRLAVVYTRAFCAFELQNTDREECMDLRHEHMKRYEVIGNIHENPELLEGE